MYTLNQVCGDVFLFVANNCNRTLVLAIGKSAFPVLSCDGRNHSLFPLYLETVLDD